MADEKKIICQNWRCPAYRLRIRKIIRKPENHRRFVAGRCEVCGQVSKWFPRKKPLVENLIDSDR